MSQDEKKKFCPVTLGDCRKDECAWWRLTTGCSVAALAHALHGTELEISRVVNELYMVRKELEGL